MSVGMNLSAMLIIMLISCTGTRIFLSGLSRISSPSVRASGLVVYVSRKVPVSSSMMRTIMRNARLMPAVVTVNIHQSKSTVPPLV